MLQNHYNYVLLGGGLTSSSAADAIRQRDPAGSILLVGQEVNRPYHRPRLNTQYLKGERQRSQIVVEPPGWFDDRHIELTTGRRASNLDTARRAVTLDSGEEIAFDKLLIATGASARRLTIPGANLPNVFTLRTLDDADRLHNAVEKALREGLRHEHGRGVVAIIGGGLLGVELAATMRQLGLSVELIIDGAHPWRKFAGPNTGSVVAHCLEKNDVVLHSGARPVRLDGDGRVQRVELVDGKIVACDFAVAAIGISPNKDILHGTPITAENAILVNEHCQTNISDIYSAGDCAAIFDPLFGKHRLIDHWNNARLTGAIAGANMAGDEARYDAVNSFGTQVFDLELRCYGEARLVDRRHVRGNPNVESPDFLEIGVAADGRIAQILAVDHRGEEADIEALVKQRVRIEGNEEAIKDPARPLQEFLR
ncbi:MAG TPA: FAD-dependent oxidoreductase [Tepidisphaeraceae bacterium]|jgi:3-phenylpropionate/trans-cinnamate dioxygenase ferredoxin reductase subunit|nr:FAD-dependent oxidoreductase [Tepidisphaeraceae bacterium]